MNQTAEKITPIEAGKDLIIFTNALATFDIKEKTIQELEKATDLEITDTASETTVRKFRQVAKSLQVNIEKHRLKLTREFKKKTDTAAGLLEPRVTAVYDKLDSKVKAVEAVKAKKKAEADQIRQEAEDKINSFFVELDTLAKTGLQYNRSSEEIAQDLGRLETFELSVIDFGERFDEAELVKADGIATTQTAFDNRLKWEKDQEESARIKKEQEIEAKKLADERAEFEAARVVEREKQAEIQAKLDLEREVKEREAAKIAEEQAKKLRLQQEQLEADRKALEDQQAEIKAREEAAALKEYSAMWDEATRLNMVVVNDSAIAMNADFDRAKAEDEKVRVEQLSAAKARAELVVKDQKKIQAEINRVDLMLSESENYNYHTNEAAQIIADMYTSLKTALDVAEKAGLELV